MRLFALTALTMMAFAANSLLTRAGVAHMDVASFGAVRLAAGAVALGALCLATGRRLHPGVRSVPGVLGLTLYILGFTKAYLGMEAGLGALLLFGTVQVTMFAGAIALREPMPLLRVLGAGLALVGLGYLVWPWQAIADQLGAVLWMVAAGLGWGVYSLAGRGSRDPLGDTAVNFALATGVYLLLSASVVATEIRITPWGLALAGVSGAVTSGLGYALWYRVLPRLGAAVGAVAQLTVPPLAMAGGILFLGEALTAKFALASVAILGGVALAVLGPVVARGQD